MPIETVIREVTSGVWTFSRPFTRMGIAAIGGRSTAIKLADGGVWVLASTILDDRTKQTIDALGPVKYIVGADAVHYLFLGEFHKAYPEAKVLTVEEVLPNAEKIGFRVDGYWNDAKPVQEFGFENDIQSCYFSGFINKDVAFFHKASRTLIQADLLFNTPCKEQYSMYGWPWRSGRTLFGLFGGFSPYSGFHKWITKNLGSKDPEAMKRDAKTVSEWDFERIIPCHGDVIEKDGKIAWQSAFTHWL
ncbi:hypothetical protein K488DRAFT_79119 [Vararia minispora EC-137]|uniref:Uncharacterized protein n=1 Tax=Vararia minispora EC-137 TaxID=1314806 RepID=A0ACB8QI18_9AGAM|nr:hypothetical protein K488DRAFT_79119 [Vararia minispora EC-137]